MNIVTTNIDVLTGPNWLFEQFKDLQHPTKNAKIHPTIDPDGDPIVGMSVLDDPDWDFIGENLIESPDGEKKNIREWLTTKKFKYEEVEI